MKRFRIYDNGGRSFDRYTIVIRDKDSNELYFWGASENPTDPQGFGMFCGQSSQGYIAGSHLGRTRIKSIHDLPETMRAFIVSCVRDCGWDYHKDCKGVFS